MEKAEKTEVLFEKPILSLKKKSDEVGGSPKIEKMSPIYIEANNKMLPKTGRSWVGKQRRELKCS